MATKEADFIAIAFSKTFLVTVTKKVQPQILITVKERMSKTKIDPAGMVTYFIIYEIVSGHFIHMEKLEALTSEIEEEVVEKTSPDNKRGLIFNLKTCGEGCMPAKTRELFGTTMRI